MSLRYSVFWTKCRSAGLAKKTFRKQGLLTSGGFKEKVRNAASWKIMYENGLGLGKESEMTEQGATAGQEQEKRVDLVLEGGGVKGIALVGALSVLEERGFQTQNVAGASAGAIVAVLHAAGYTSTELQEIIGGLDYDRFKDRAWEDQIPFAGSYLSIHPQGSGNLRG